MELLPSRNEVVYCIDTSALIAAWNERYPPPNFPPFWTSVDQLVSAHRLVSPVDVRLELKKDESLKKWADNHKQMFLELEEAVQLRTREILAHFTNFAKQYKRRHFADPFVVALAKEKGLVVVTEEAFGTSGKPGIPLICSSLSIECVKLIDMVQRENWIL